MSLNELVELYRACYTSPSEEKASLSERFLLPPFTVLDARQGYWQNRKRAWLAIGIKSELGRGDTASTSARIGPDEEATYRTIGGRKPNATPGGSLLPATSLKDGKTRRGDGRGRPLTAAPGGSPLPLVKGKDGYQSRRPTAILGGDTGKNSAYMFKTADGYQSLKEQGEKKFAKAYNIGMNANAENGWQLEDNQGSGTSIFDPVICELAYRWFTPVGGRVLDPFAGGSVRGIVAARLQRSYTGIDLRAEQIAANEEQGALLCPNTDLRWVTGDSSDVGTLAPGTYDFVFSCPPYADLERYSDDPRDISTMSYDDFIAVYRTIIRESCKLLKDNRFACFVVGLMRDKRGMYRDFVSDTIAAFRDAGLELYNDAVLVTSVGSLPIRVGKQFTSSRKLGRTHQNVLIFVKGDPTLAVEACGPVDTSDVVLPDVGNDTSIGIVAEDLDGIDTDLLEGRVATDDSDLVTFTCGQVEAALVCDILRCRARATGGVPRVWTTTSGRWEQVPNNLDMVYLVGSTPYLNQAVFLSAPVPKASAPQVRRLGGG